MKAAVLPARGRPGHLHAYGARGEAQQRVDQVAYWLTGLLTAAPEPTSLQTWTVAGAGHTRGLATAPTEWEERVIGFLSDALEGSAR